MKAFMESPPPFIPEIYVDDNDITSELVVGVFFVEKKRERKRESFFPLLLSRLDALKKKKL